MALRADLVPDALMATTLAVEEVRSVTELERLGPAWDRLAGASAEPMQSHAWTLAAARTLHAGQRLRIFVVRRGSALAAVAPLVEVTRRGWRWLEIAGAAHLYEPLRLLADSDESLEVLGRAIAGQPLPLQLQRLERGAGAEALRDGLRGRAVILEARSSPCLRVELGPQFDVVSGGLSSERAAALRRKRRQLEKLGEVSLESLQPAPANVEEVLREAFELEARGWKGVAGSAVLQKPAQFAFFCDLGRRYAADGALLVRRLRVGGEVAAVHVAAVQGHVCYELKIAFDEKFARQSPGVLLTLECLRDGASRDFRAHEFLGSAASWQEQFTRAEREFRNLLVFPFSVTGLSALTFEAAGIGIRRGARLARHAAMFATRMPRELWRAAGTRVSAWRGRWFDWRNRVDTDTRIAVEQLPDIDARLARHAVHYEATSIPKFERGMAVVGGRADGFSFIDLGSGKGRVLMLAARRSFRRVIGVEISRQLHGAAVANTMAFARRNRGLAPIECTCADASAWTLPDGDLLVFLYNPFDAALLARVRDRIHAAGAQGGRRLCVVYVNPLHHTLFDNDDFTCDHLDSSFAVYWHNGRKGAGT